MEHEVRQADIPTVEALVNAFEAGSVSRRAFLRRAGLLGLTAAAAGALADAAAPRRARAQTTQKRDLVVAQGGDISKFDPHFSTSSNDIRVSFNVFDTLTSRHPDQKLYPSLATEWKATGPTTWTFKLRSGVKWHNGDPFTAADAKFSLERTYDPAAKTMVGTVFTTIDRIEAPDPTTLVIHTKKSDPLLPDRLAFYGGQIVPRKYLEQVGPDTFNAKPVGTGPLRLLSWTKDDKAVFEAFPDYWGGKIDVDSVVFRPIPETAPRVAAVLKGEVDAITQLPSDHWDRVNQNPTTRGVGALYAGLYVLGINAKVPPLNNQMVRQALSLSIDREAIVKDLYRGRAIVPNGPIAQGDRHYDPSLPPLKYDPRAARDLVKKSGYKNEPVVIETTIGYVAQDKVMSEAIAGMWKDVGLNAVVEVVEYSVRAEKNRNKTFKGLWWSDPTSTLRDPDGMMWRLLGPGGPQDYFRDPEWDELGNAARFSLDEKFRGEAYRKMTKIMLEKAFGWVIIMQPYEDYGLQRYVDFTPNPNQQFEVRRFNFRMRRA
ncbi:MAG TPA: ABC transporter substrate-binding protein [Methylomirabilota bacterium]|jgi:peptide/nickel transport system substrate-binding protein|nr:ABC transporter substrate-binding protein [Methylomirabilota bacterium]